MPCKLAETESYWTSMTGNAPPNRRPAQAEAVAFLENPQSYDFCQAPPSQLPRTDIRRIATQGAIVFLTGDKAIKIKRAVRYPDLDFSSLEKRRQALGRELVLNRRTAPEPYEGLLALVRNPDGGLVLKGPLEPEETPDDEVLECGLRGDCLAANGQQPSAERPRGRSAPNSVLN